MTSYERRSYQRAHPPSRSGSGVTVGIDAPDDACPAEAGEGTGRQRRALSAIVASPGAPGREPLRSDLAVGQRGAVVAGAPGREPGWALPSPQLGDGVDTVREPPGGGLQGLLRYLLMAEEPAVQVVA